MSPPRRKPILAWTLAVMQVVLCGCAHQYLIKLTNGDQILAYSKPKVQDENYLFTDEMGGSHVIPQDRVVKIKPVSVVKAEAKPPAPAKPLAPPMPRKPRHWYFLWLA